MTQKRSRGDQRRSRAIKGKVEKIMNVDHIHSPPKDAPLTPAKKKRRLKNAALTDQNRLMLVLGDSLALVLALTLSGVSSLWLGDFIVGAEYDLNFRQSVFLRLFQFVLFSGFFLIWMNDRGHYDHRLPFWTEIKQIVVVFSMAAMFDGFLQYLMRAEFSRIWLIQNWAFAVVFVMMSRSIVKHIMQKQGSWSLNTIIVGTEFQAQAVIKAINAEKNLGYKITRIMAPWELALVDGSDYVKSLYSPYNAQFVLLAMDSPEVEKFGGIISSFIRQRLPFAFVPPTGGMPVLGLDPIYFFNHDLVLLTAQNNLAHPFAQMVKQRSSPHWVIALLFTAFLPVILLSHRRHERRRTDILSPSPHRPARSPSAA
ncbi:membrane hypothetical protein [Azospirillaceae bacterium]